MKNPVSVQPMPVYQAIATALDALRRCEAKHNDDVHSQFPADHWPKMAEMHRKALMSIVCECLPSGSGIDNGTKFDFDASTPDKLVLAFAYHHMNQHGFYDCWTKHRAVITPSLAFGIDIRITGDKVPPFVRHYFEETYQAALTEMLEANRPEPQTAVNS